jgi:hypothetical protein
METADHGHLAGGHGLHDLGQRLRGLGRHVGLADDEIELDDAVLHP